MAKVSKVRRGTAVRALSSGRTARSARLSKRGTALLIVGVAAIIAAYAGSRPELLTLGVLLVLLPTLAIAFVRYRRIDLAVTRQFTPGVVAAGLPVSVELRLENRAITPTPLLRWRDAHPWSDGNSAAGELPPLSARRSRTIASGTTAVLHYELVPPRRGIVPIGPLSVSLADPFGLSTGFVSVGDSDDLVVTPLVSDLPENGLAVQSSDGASMLVRRAVGGEDDLSTREYRRGDALRRVHWRATARHGDIMVRQEEPRSHAEARVIVDTRRGGYSDLEPLRGPETPESAAFELALELAASVSLHLARSGFVIDLQETGFRQLAPVFPVTEFLQSLATVSLTPEPRGVVGTLPRRSDDSRGTAFAIVADADPSVIDSLIAQRPGFDLAVAFVIESAETAIALSQSGWTCVQLSARQRRGSGESAGDVIGAWQAVAQARGLRFG